MRANFFLILFITISQSLLAQDTLINILKTKETPKSSNKASQLIGSTWKLEMVYLTDSDSIMVEPDSLDRYYILSKRQFLIQVSDSLKSDTILQRKIAYIGTAFVMRAGGEQTIACKIVYLKNNILVLKRSYHPYKFIDKSRIKSNGSRIIAGANKIDRSQKFTSKYLLKRE